MSKLYWKLQFAKRHQILDPIDKDKSLCLEFKNVDGITYVVKEYVVYNTVEPYMTDLFANLLPKLRNYLYSPLSNSLFK